MKKNKSIAPIPRPGLARPLGLKWKESPVPTMEELLAQEKPPRKLPEYLLEYRASRQSTMNAATSAISRPSVFATDSSSATFSRRSTMVNAASSLILNASSTIGSAPLQKQASTLHNIPHPPFYDRPQEQQFAKDLTPVQKIRKEQEETPPSARTPRVKMMEQLLLAFKDMKHVVQEGIQQSREGKALFLCEEMKQCNKNLEENVNPVLLALEETGRKANALQNESKGEDKEIASPILVKKAAAEMELEAKRQALLEKAMQMAGLGHATASHLDEHTYTLVEKLDCMMNTTKAMMPVFEEPLTEEQIKEQQRLADLEARKRRMRQPRASSAAKRWLSNNQMRCKELEEFVNSRPALARYRKQFRRRRPEENHDDGSSSSSHPDSEERNQKSSPNKESLLQKKFQEQTGDHILLQRFDKELSGIQRVQQMEESRKRFEAWKMERNKKRQNDALKKKIELENAFAAKLGENAAAYEKKTMKIEAFLHSMESRKSSRRCATARSAERSRKDKAKSMEPTVTSLTPRGSNSPRKK